MTHSKSMTPRLPSNPRKPFIVGSQVRFTGWCSNSGEHNHPLSGLVAVVVRSTQLTTCVDVDLSEAVASLQATCGMTESEALSFFDGCKRTSYPGCTFVRFHDVWTQPASWDDSLVELELL